MRLSAVFEGCNLAAQRSGVQKSGALFFYHPALNFAHNRHAMTLPTRKKI